MCELYCPVFTGFPRLTSSDENIYLVCTSEQILINLGVKHDSPFLCIALKLHSEEHKYIEAKSISAKLKFNSASPR